MAEFGQGHVIKRIPRVLMGGRGVILWLNLPETRAGYCCCYQNHEGRF
jgi:hypothetical protein